MVLDRERELMRDHVKKVGVRHILITYIFVLAVIIFIEAFASYNIHLLKEVEGGAMIMRDIFSIVAVIVVAFTVVANIIFLGGRSKADTEFHYYFRTRPLLLYSATAVIGDIIAVFLVHNTSYPYMVFFTSLIALNLFAIGFAIYSVEKAISKADSL
ncbi:hypothetical protein KY359_04425 [Candidatus Woesearchaeota archaeon]|nr:hypothetical protein [Candidatus Woesearchaeota archaeon]